MYYHLSPHITMGRRTAIRLPLVVVEYLLQLILCCTCHCTRLITYTCADDDQSGLVSMCLCYDVHRNYVLIFTIAVLLYFGVLL